MLLQGATRAEDRIPTLQSSLPENARQALLRIDGIDRKLLALRGYLRSARTLEARWSWNQAEIERYNKSEEYAAALEAVSEVMREFETRNEGYTLHVNTQVRSLDEQLDHWNRNVSVAAAGSELEEDLKEWRDERSDPSTSDVKTFLTNWQPSSPVSIATPGVSPHGRALAFDFQVQQGSRIIAGADTDTIETVWNGGGWAHKLKTAVEASGASFVGPLEHPPEPWHYDYQAEEREDDRK